MMSEGAASTAAGERTSAKVEAKRAQTTSGFVLVVAMSIFFCCALILAGRLGVKRGKLGGSTLCVVE